MREIAAASLAGGAGGLRGRVAHEAERDGAGRNWIEVLRGASSAPTQRSPLWVTCGRPSREALGAGPAAQDRGGCPGAAATSRPRSGRRSNGWPRPSSPPAGECWSKRWHRPRSSCWSRRSARHVPSLAQDRPRRPLDRGAGRRRRHPRPPRRSGSRARSARCGAPLLTGARGRQALDVEAAARVASAAGSLLDAQLDLIELNPVFVTAEGAIAVDADPRSAVYPGGGQDGRRERGHRVGRDHHGGFMGSGIAGAGGPRRIEVLVHEPDRRAAGTPATRVAASVAKAVEAALRRCRGGRPDGAHHLDHRDRELAGCGLAIEAVVEDSQVKGEVFQRLDAAARAHGADPRPILSIPIAQLAAWTERRDKVLGMHFFSPAQVMKLVELWSASRTSGPPIKAAFRRTASASIQRRSGPRTAQASSSTRCWCRT